MAAAEGHPPLPSLERQRTYIVENEHLLDRRASLEILRIVMMEVGAETPAAGGGTVPVVLESAAGLSILLDNIADAEVVTHIYNIVRGRWAALSEPAHRKRR